MSAARKRTFGASPQVPTVRRMSGRFNKLEDESNTESNEQKLTRNVTRSLFDGARAANDTTDVTAQSSRASSSKREFSARKGGPGQNSKGQPLELYQTNYITMMKASEADPNIQQSNTLKITDSWRQDWHRGVQVPVKNIDYKNQNWTQQWRLVKDDCEAETAASETEPVAKLSRVSADEPSTSSQSLQTQTNTKHTFHLPKKYVGVFKRAGCSNETHRFVCTSKTAESVCPYDVDELDSAWLLACNNHRHSQGVGPISVDRFEQVLECLETISAEQIEKSILNPSSTNKYNNNCGREFDDDSACDVCMSPNQDEDDCIVFCDGCDLSVHQSCYGVTHLPEGAWLCRVCSLVGNHLPPCQLCPNRGGAMKCTQSGEKWAHVSCVLWIPEVRFGDPENLEPVMHLASVPEERWKLKCCVCEKQDGACVQCDVPKCRLSYHVTCAQRKRLEMTSVTLDNGELSLRSYCQKHSRSNRQAGVFDNHSPTITASTSTSTTSPSRLSARQSQSKRCRGRPRMSTEPDNPDHEHTQSGTGPLHSPNRSNQHTHKSPNQMLDSPRKRKARRIQSMYCQFYKFASTQQCMDRMNIQDELLVSQVFEYWKLKRKRNNDAPLLTSREDEAEMLERQEEEALIRRTRSLIAIRQNLEKARNLCYLLIRREKLKKEYVNELGQTAHTLHSIVADQSCLLSKREAASLTTNYLRPICAADEVMIDRVTDQQIDTQAAEWVVECGGDEQSWSNTQNSSTAAVHWPVHSTNTPATTTTTSPNTHTQTHTNHMFTPPNTPPHRPGVRPAVRATVRKSEQSPPVSVPVHDARSRLQVARQYWLDETTGHPNRLLASTAGAAIARRNAQFQYTLPSQSAYSTNNKQKTVAVCGGLSADFEEDDSELEDKDIVVDGDDHYEPSRMCVSGTNVITSRSRWPSMPRLSPAVPAMHKQQLLASVPSDTNSASTHRHRHTQDHSTSAGVGAGVVYVRKGATQIAVNTNNNLLQMHGWRATPSWQTQQSIQPARRLSVGVPPGYNAHHRHRHTGVHTIYSQDGARSNNSNQVVYSASRSPVRPQSTLVRHPAQPVQHLRRNTRHSDIIHSHSEVQANEYDFQDDD